MKPFFHLTLAIWACASAFAEEVVIPLADQRDYTDSPNGCAPASLLNLLRCGGDEYAPVLKGLVGGTDGVRMRFLVDRYFRNRPSSVEPGQPRWGLHGIACEDLATGFNELLAEHELRPLEARYLDLEDGETEVRHLQRVRSLIADSLDAGMPPILSLRSFYVKHREENELAPQWESGINHVVLVTALRGEPSATGFEMEVIDPWKGRRTVIYLHREANGLSFRALRGNAVSGIWLNGRPFLQVIAPEIPSLRPANLEWSDRYLVVANCLLGRF